MTNEDERALTLPRNWSWTSIREVSFLVTKGSTPTSYGFGFAKQGINFIKVENIANGSIARETIKEFITQETHDFLKRSQLAENDVLFSIAGTIGRVAVVRRADLPANINQAIAVIRCPWRFLSPQHLKAFLESALARAAIQKKPRGVGMKNVGLEDVKNINFPLAPFNEQIRIVARLEQLFARLDAGVEGLRKVKAQLKRYRQAVLKYAFDGKLTEEWRKTHKDQMEPATKLLQQIKQEIGDGKDENHVREQLAVSAELPKLPETWIWTMIGEVETFIGSGITPRGGRRVYVDRGIPFIRSQNVHADGLRLKDIVYLTQQQHAEMERTHTKPNDVLLNITGASIGRSAYIPQELDKANVNQHVCIIRTGWWIVPSYLSHFLNSSYGQDQIFQTQSGVTRQGLNYAQVRNLRIPLAPLPEQNLIVDKIEEMLSSAHDFEKAIIRSLAQTERLRQSILKAAFDGMLVPQDPNDEPAEKLLERIKAERAKSNGGEKDTNKGRKNKPKQLELNTYVK